MYQNQKQAPPGARNFVATPSVQFGTMYSPGVTFVSNKVLSVTTPTHGMGTVDLTVINPDLQSDTLPGGFTFLFSSPPPVITSVDPDNGDITGGDTVTVYGTPPWGWFSLFSLGAHIAPSLRSWIVSVVLLIILAGEYLIMGGADLILWLFWLHVIVGSFLSYKFL